MHDNPSFNFFKAKSGFFVSNILGMLSFSFNICVHVNKRQLGRPRLRWEDNIKMDLQEVGGSCRDWMELVQDTDRWRALVGAMRNLRFPKLRGIS